MRKGGALWRLPINFSLIRPAGYQGLRLGIQLTDACLEKLYTWLRSRSQLGMGRALTLETMPIAANRVMMDEPP